MPELRKGELTDDQAKFCRANCVLFQKKPYPNCSLAIHINEERKSRMNKEKVIKDFSSQIPEEGCPKNY